MTFVRFFSPLFVLLFWSSLLPLEAQETRTATENLQDLVVKMVAEDLPKLEDLIAEGADVNETGKSGVTALVKATFLGSEEAVDLLLSAGADIDGVTSANETALVVALANKQFSLAEKFLALGADPNILNSSGWGPLAFAVSNGNWDLVELLLQKGADFDRVTQNKESLLLIALGRTQFAIAEKLLKAGVDPNLENNQGQAPLIFAVGHGNLAMTKNLLAAGANTEPAPPARTLTALTLAVKNGRLDLAEMLLNAGADINFSARGASTPLVEAINSQKLDALRFLLEWRDSNGKTALDVNALGSDNNSPLYTASGRGFDEYAQLLLAHGANPNQASEVWGGDTPLHRAAFTGAIEIVRMLLEGAADVNTLNNKGHTPLSYAVMREQKEIVSLLLYKGANQHPSSVREGRVKSPRQLAIEKKNEEIALMLYRGLPTCSGRLEMADWNLFWLTEYFSLKSTELSVLRGSDDVELTLSGGALGKISMDVTIRSAHQYYEAYQVWVDGDLAFEGRWKHEINKKTLPGFSQDTLHWILASETCEVRILGIDSEGKADPTELKSAFSFPVSNFKKAHRTVLENMLIAAENEKAGYCRKFFFGF